uniref:Uncharacterized protein n=1 Tax=Rhizochromulina marina TaxID=1034831 RepID=A0A7S2WV20_9STRA|mmetsp:Transcript_765/g.2465  ORF Transcript_765/g.2465 Transcript_765/m.2465 type:complete len:115 (+) Transcript_765:205-549(+)
MAPRVRIPAQVLVYTVGIVVPTAAVLGLTYPFRKSEEEKLRVLDSKYGDKVRVARQRRENLQQFFDNVRRGDEETEKKLNEVMHGGKKKMVRHYRLDDERRAPAPRPPPSRPES